MTCLVGGHGGGLPEVWSGEESLQQLRHRLQPGRLRRKGYAADAEVVDQLTPSLLSSLLVPVDREGALDTSRVNRIETDDHPDLPHAWKSLADGSRTSLCPVVDTAISL